MDRFTEAYDKARKVFQNENFDAEWEKILASEVQASRIMAEAGPEVGAAGGLDTLRGKLSEKSRGAIRDWLGLGTSSAAAIAEAADPSRSAAFNDRAATLKMLAHLYMLQKKGSQNLWVYSPPKAYSKWVFDELTGSQARVRRRLGRQVETYSESEKKVMAAALQCAAKWSADATVKLGGDRSNEANALVRDWFGDEDTTDEQITAAIKKLQQGFTQVAMKCNSNKLIFSDEPIDRNSGGWKDWAFIYRDERLDVVYLQGAFLKAGNSGKMWQCALTIVHELTHIALGTDDYQYEPYLKPGKEVRSLEIKGAFFNHTNAMKNADSWAFFAADLAGALSKADKERVRK